MWARSRVAGRRALISVIWLVLPIGPLLALVRPLLILILALLVLILPLSLVLLRGGLALVLSIARPRL
jgi:hypothetical protein